MANNTEKYDHLLFQIIESEGQLTPFLDVIFSFLYRRTDFYKIQHNKHENMGFPKGVAEQFVKDAFLRYYNLAMQDEEHFQNQLLLSKSTGQVPPVAKEVEVKEEKEKLNPKPNPDSQKVCESYNGAVRDNYRWSQTITDIDVHVKVPEYVNSSRFVSVSISNSRLKVSYLANKEVEGEKWETVIDDDLVYKINGEDTIWNLIKGEEIFISMEKSEERWWDSLLQNEPKINTQTIDNSRPYEDLDEESRAKIDELMYNERCKADGQLTTEQMKVEKALKEAWNAEGSPFIGQSYDPTLVTQVVGNLQK